MSGYQTESIESKLDVNNEENKNQLHEREEKIHINFNDGLFDVKLTLLKLLEDKKDNDKKIQQIIQLVFKNISICTI
jgi:hypothetical protein